MSYSIATNTIDATAGFSLVERSVWHYANGGTWSTTNVTETLVMGGSGTSGALRFKNGAGEYFLVALGIHNYKRWCDIVTDLSPGDTAVKILPEYYEEGNPRGEMLWKQLAEIEKKSKSGTSVHVKYVKEDENSFIVHINIS